MLLFLSTQQLLIIALIALLLFGGTRLPKLMRSLGQSVNEFKKGMNETNMETIKGEEKEEKKVD